MSTAGPTPPPHRSSLPSQPAGQAHDRNASPTTPILHLSDIVAQAEAAVNSLEPIARLLERAQTSLGRASSYLEFYKRPDYALFEFFVARNIITRLIPSHKDVALVRGDNIRLRTLYGECIRSYQAQETRIEEVKELVKADNRASGVLPRSAPPSSSDSSAHSSSSSPPPTPPQHAVRPRSLQSTSVPPNTVGTPTRYNPNRSSIATTSLSNPPGSNQRPPAVQPKPPNLHGTALASNGRNTPVQEASTAAPSTDLYERFLRLRSNGSNPSPSSTNGQLASNGESPSRSRPAIASVNLNNPLPKLPSPTYSSPIRNTPPPPPPPHSTSTTSSSSQSPRTSVSSQSTNFSSLNSNPSLLYQSLQSNYSSARYAPPTNAAPAAPNEPRPVPRRRRQSEHRPQEVQVSAERLYDYLKTFNVLLIDVRTRDEYDNGHIFSQSVICVEPVALRANMSAEELLDSLCISPDYEPELFERRDKFDLVVYYDQNTETTDFLSGKPGTNTSLKYLHDALSDFNQEKPLSWQPILLSGGMTAWIDLLGPNALATSNTAASRNKAAAASRPLARRPAISESTPLNLQKRRHREYNPLAPEEEQKWREKARSESVSLQSPLPQPVEEADEDESTASQSPGQQDSSNLNDFQNRYPDVETVERQVQQTVPPPRSSPPGVPRVPSYPAAPVPSVPSRPPPAVPRPSYSGVSERISSQTSGVSKSSQLAPYIPPQLMRLPKTGLHNFGVTCYMNATIQCLSSTIPLTAFFFDGQFKRYIQQDNWKGSKGLMPELYNTLLLNLWSCNEKDTIRPLNFRNFCARLNREWGVDRQQDAKEFLEFLIDTLHEDFNIGWAGTPLKALTAEQEAWREKTHPFLISKLEWDRYIHRDNSKMTGLFGGQHLSRLQCTTCKQSSTTYETFYSISVEIPQATSKKKVVTLDDCLRSYCSAEMLGKEDYWRCPNCKAPRQASKRITITRAPQFLVIHLKRFSASHTERAKKVHTPVDFPLSGLDLEPYMLPPPDEKARAWLKTYGSESLYTPPSMTPPYKYDAYAVMRHIGGTMTSGHYISLVEDKARGCWREFNDDRVTDFKPEQLDQRRSLQNEQAYIVFYQRVN